MANENRVARSTRQRAAISRALERARGFRTAQELHQDLRRSGAKVGLTTVYRTLQGMVEAGEVDVVRAASSEAIYRLCSKPDHHHHLVCRGCGHGVEVADARIEEWAQRTATRHGFTEVSHEVEVFGLCRDCGAG